MSEPPTIDGPDAMDRLRDRLRSICDEEVPGRHVAFARSHFDAALFHLRIHRETMAVAGGTQKMGDSRRIEHAG